MSSLKPGEYVVGGSHLRRFTALTETGADIRLNDTRNTEAVYWSREGNSYVVNDNPTGYWNTFGGTPCDLISINGAGELRWVVSSRSGNTAGDTDAAEYFGLTFHGYRGSL